MARASSTPRTSVDSATLATIVDRVKREGALKPAALGLGKLTRAAEAELVEGLARAGLEHTGKAVRLPLRPQLLALFDRAGAGGVAASAIARGVKGARNAAEVALALRELSDEGLLAPVVEAKTVRWARRGEELLSEAELDDLAALAKRLSDLAKKTKAPKGKPRPTLARASLEEAAGLLRAMAGRASPHPIRSVLCAALRAAPATGGLVRVPDVVRALEGKHPRAGLLAELDALAREGWLELRPEAGIGRMSDEDRAACTKALDGTPLSYARVVGAGHGGEP